MIVINVTTRLRKKQNQKKNYVCDQVSNQGTTVNEFKMILKIIICIWCVWWI